MGVVEKKPDSAHAPTKLPSVRVKDEFVKYNGEF
jgi:hypothetical protein